MKPLRDGPVQLEWPTRHLQPGSGKRLERHSYVQRQRENNCSAGEIQKGNVRVMRCEASLVLQTFGVLWIRRALVKKRALWPFRNKTTLRKATGFSLKRAFKLVPGNFYGTSPQVQRINTMMESITVIIKTFPDISILLS